MRVLLIDDQPDNVSAVVDAINLRYANSQCTVASFQEAQGKIDDHSPQVVILDLLQGAGADKVPLGLDTRAYIWDQRFCPLIIYTAAPELLADAKNTDHPFMRVVTKGMDSDTLVLTCIEEFEPHIRALDDAQTEVRRTMNQALKNVAPLLFKGTQNQDQRREMVVRSARRRVAAQMDEALLTEAMGEPALKSWECYLFPPVTEQLMMGDIVYRNGSDAGDPNNYAIILTPSCDLVKTEKRPPKVKRVLVAYCTVVDRVLKDLNLPSWSNKHREKLEQFLTQGYGHSCVPLPSIPGLVPPMAADLRNLDLIPFENIGNSDTEYIRIASIDNPWRELLAWAYMLVSARPGMPDRETSPWADEMISLFAKPAGDK